MPERTFDSSEMSAGPAQALETPDNPAAAAARCAWPAQATRAVDTAITSRRSVRAFLPEPVPRETVEAILAVASRAPSGTNTQPWRVYAVAGSTRDALAATLAQAYEDPERESKYVQEYTYYPRRWVSPYIDRRRKIGWDLYGLLGIAKTDRSRMHAQHARNFRFFDAPVALFFTIDRVMEIGSWLDYGMFLQNIMVAARARGLDTCPQAAFAQFHRVIGQQLGFRPDEQLVCGMSLGYADPDAIENRLHTEREPVEAFAQFRGEWT